MVPPRAPDYLVAHAGQSAAASVPHGFTPPQVTVPQTLAAHTRSILIGTAYTEYDEGPSKTQGFTLPYTSVAYGADGPAIGTA